MYSIAYTMYQAPSYGLPKFRKPGHILIVAFLRRLHMAGETFLTQKSRVILAAYCVLFIDNMEILITHTVSENSSKGKRLACLSNCLHFQCLHYPFVVCKFLFTFGKILPCLYLENVSNIHYS